MLFSGYLELNLKEIFKEQIATTQEEHLRLAMTIFYGMFDLKSEDQKNRLIATAQYDKISPLMVPVAQLAEHLTVDQVVEGPSPFRHPRR